MKKKFSRKHPELLESRDVHANSHHSSSKFVLETFSQESHPQMTLPPTLPTPSPPYPTSLPLLPPKSSENKPSWSFPPPAQAPWLLHLCLPCRSSVEVPYATQRVGGGGTGSQGFLQNRHNDSGICKALSSLPLLDLSKKVSCPGLHA